MSTTIPQTHYWHDIPHNWRINLPALRCREFNLCLKCTSLCTAIPHYWRIIDVRFYVSVVEDFSGVDVDDMLQLRKKKHFFWTCFWIMCSIWACHWNLLSTMRPSRRCSVTFSIFSPSNDSLSDKSDSWCFCRVVITIEHLSIYIHVYFFG